jgi:hypothetical protein|tara:strand:+ start:457 stop:909 length:453 start_codon:yes stop_codon:yes gene_type:complete
MAKTIRISTIVNIEGRPIRIPKRDVDGDVVWQTTCPVCNTPEPNTQPELEELDTIKAVRSLIFQLPPSLRKPDDPQNSFHLLNAVRQNDGELLTLEDDEYDFLHRLIDREVSNGEEDAVTETMGSALWGMNSYVVIQQLTPDGIDIMVQA